MLIQALIGKPCLCKYYKTANLSLLQIVIPSYAEEKIGSRTIWLILGIL